MTAEVWLLVKRNLYYRPNFCGYTGIRDEAGRYSEADARAHVGDGESGVSMVRESEAPEYTRDCYRDARDTHASAKAEAFRERMHDTLDAISPVIIMLNARRICATRYRREPNWVIAMELFGLGSTYAFGLCRRHGIDPDAKTIDRAAT